MESSQGLALLHCPGVHQASCQLCVRGEERGREGSGREGSERGGEGEGEREG